METLNHFLKFKSEMVVLAIISSLFLSCSKEDFIDESDLLNVENVLVFNEIDGRYIVTLSEKPSSENPKREEVLRQVFKEVESMSGARITRKYQQTFSGFAAKLTEEQVLILKKDKRIKSIVKDTYLYLDNEVIVQAYPTWGLDRIDSRDSYLDRAYTYSSTGSGITAYIIDSGINYAHQEFNGRASLGYDFVLEEEPESTDPNQSPGEDCNGHGTHVAGTVGGNIYGVAKNVKLVSVRVFGYNGSTSLSMVLAAVEWVTINAVKPAVVNMSLGGEADLESQTLNIAIENSIKSGVNYVVSAGNSYNNACLFSPANVNNAITVGASDISNNMANYSNYGECLDVFAPGTNILSASYLGNNSTTIKSGTSMASPHVAGVVALYLEKNPAASTNEVHTAIVENSIPNRITQVPQGSSNLVNNQWEPINFIPPSSPNLNLEGFALKEKRSLEIALTWVPTDDPWVKIYMNGEILREVENTGLYFRTMSVKPNDTFNFQVCEINYENCSDIVIPTSVDSRDAMPNQPPVANFQYQINDLSVSFIDRSGDNDGGTIESWNWDFGDGNFSTLQHPEHSYSAYGYYRVNLTISDNRGGSDSSGRWINLTEPLPEPEPVDLILSTIGYRVKSQEYTDLTWTPSGTSENVDIYLNGKPRKTVPNTGSYTDRISVNGNTTLTYKVCISDSNISCSNQETVVF